MLRLYIVLIRNIYNILEQIDKYIIILNPFFISVVFIILKGKLLEIIVDYHINSNCHITLFT